MHKDELRAKLDIHIAKKQETDARIGPGLYNTEQRPNERKLIEYQCFNSTADRSCQELRVNSETAKIPTLGPGKYDRQIHSQ